MKNEIAMWHEVIGVYTAALAEAERYGDTGGMEWDQHMIEFAQGKIDELERKSA